MLKQVFVHYRFTFSDHDGDLSNFHARTIGWQRLCVSHLAEPRVTVACFLFDFSVMGERRCGSLRKVQRCTAKITVVDLISCDSVFGQTAMQGSLNNVQGFSGHLLLTSNDFDEGLASGRCLQIAIAGCFSWRLRQWSCFFCSYKFLQLSVPFQKPWT